MPKCDFCGIELNPGVGTVFKCPTFNLVTLLEDNVIFVTYTPTDHAEMATSLAAEGFDLASVDDVKTITPDWLACPTCTPFIERGSREALLSRSTWRLSLNSPPDKNMPMYYYDVDKKGNRVKTQAKDINAAFLSVIQEAFWTFKSDS